MDFFAELLAWITGRKITRVIWSGIGWLYLKVTLRNKIKIKQALIEKYDGSYATAGFFLVSGTVGILFILMLLLAWLSLIVGIVLRGLNVL